MRLLAYLFTFSVYRRLKASFMRGFDFHIAKSVRKWEIRVRSVSDRPLSQCAMRIIRIWPWVWMSPHMAVLICSIIRIASLLGTFLCTRVWICTPVWTFLLSSLRRNLVCAWIWQSSQRWLRSRVHRYISPLRWLLSWRTNFTALQVATFIKILLKLGNCISKVDSRGSLRCCKHWSDLFAWFCFRWLWLARISDYILSCS